MAYHYKTSLIMAVIFSISIAVHSLICQEALAYQEIPKQAGAKVPISVFGALPEIEDAAVSPDGKTVALLENVGDSTLVRFFNLANGDSNMGLRIGKVKARGLSWASNEKILLQVSQASRIDTVSGFRTYELWRFAAISKDTGKVQYLLTKGEFSVYTNAGTLLHTLPDDPDKVLIMKRVPNFALSRNANSRINNAASGREVDNSSLDIFSVSLKSGNGRTKFNGNNNTTDWIVNDKGEPILRIDVDDSKNEKTINRKVEGSRKFAEVSKIEGKTADISIYALSDAGLRSSQTTKLAPNQAIVTSYNGRNTIGVYNYDYEQGKIMEPLFQSDAVDVGGLRVENGQLISISHTDDKPVVDYQDPEFAKITKSLSAALAGARLNVVSSSKDRSVSIIQAIYVDRPSTYYLFERSTRSLSVLGPTYARLNETNSGKRQKYDYRSEDGFLIKGYLTLPVGQKESKNMPLIVLPHGGPEARDNLEFDWWAGAYASRGYAVYQPNFRGSSGYGDKFRRAGWGEWGRKMQDDISNGVRKLVADGIVNADRICIVGASYGGYAALAGATLTPELYQCSVSVNGVSDLLVMLGTESRDSEIGLAFWQRRIGDRRNQDELKSVSPRHLARAARAPVMLIHGRDDTVVPYGQSKIMDEALTAQGKKVEFITLDGEDHWLSGAETRTKMLEASTRFIDQHIGQ